MNINVPNATKTLSTYSARLSLDAIPDSVVEQAKIVLADTVGILLKASTRRAVGTGLRTFPPVGNGPCTIVGHGSGATPDQAAFINGIGGHDIELDDSHSPSRTHAAAVIVPAALAAAEASDKCTGADLLAGIIAAYDVQCRISKAMGVQSQFDRGFHPTVVCGTIGAAVCAGRILGLDEETMCYVIGLATSQSCGLITFEDDPSHMLKSFHTGLGARNGLVAALLASNGYESSPDALSGRHNVLTAFGGATANVKPLTDGLGEYYEITGTSLKRHACCGQTHSSLDALLSLMKEHDLTAKDIEAIDVKLAHKAVSIVDGNPLWTHNIQYVLALAAHEGYVGVHHFDDEWTSNASVNELSRRVTVSGSDKLQERFPTKKGAIVTITIEGRTLSREVEAPVGNPATPLTAQDLKLKFFGLVSSVLSAADSERLWNDLARVESLDCLDGIFALLRQRPRA